MNTDDGTTLLRRRLERVEGAGRGRILAELAQKLAMSYWRAGVGRPDGVPLLEEALSRYEEAHHWFSEGSLLRAQIAGAWGWLLGIRHLAHQGPETDRERGITLLEEALSCSGLPRAPLLVSRISLGQLLMARVFPPGPGLGAMMTITTAPLRGGGADLRRAASHFRQVKEDPAAGADLLAVAEPLFELAEAFSGGFPDIARVQRAASAMAGLQRRMGSSGGLFGGADVLAGMDPIDRPVVVMEGPVPAGPSAEPAAPTRVTPSRAGAAELRTALADRLPPGTLLRLLAPGASLDVALVDDVNALAGQLVAAPGATGEDQLLLAAALYLRSHTDDGGWAAPSAEGGWAAPVAGGGWAAPVAGGGDREAAAASLLTAVPALPMCRAENVALAYRLAARLDEHGGDARLRERVAAGLTPVVKALRTRSVEALVYPCFGAGLVLSATTGGLSPLVPASLPARILVAGELSDAGDRVVSHVRTGAQVMDLAARPRPPLSAAPALVAAGAAALRDSFYPRAPLLTTAPEVRGHVRASMLHLSCGVTAGGDLELAGGTRLGARQLAAGGTTPGRGGGLAVLPPGPGTTRLATALLTTHYAGAVAWRTGPPPEIVTLLTWVLHHHLAVTGTPAPHAVHAVRRWLADPRREPPPTLPDRYRPLAASTTLTDPACTTALLHRGL